VPGELNQALADILQEGVFGFDTETRPAFRKGEMHLPSLVQVATARRGLTPIFLPRML